MESSEQKRCKDLSHWKRMEFNLWDFEQEAILKEGFEIVKFRDGKFYDVKTCEEVILD